MQFNEQQLAVIDHRVGPVCVDAAAGVGKTATIVERIARMLEDGQEPGRVLLVTFSVKAALEMAERIEKRTGSPLPWATNFHRLCARLLRSFPDFGIPRGYTILDDQDQVALLKRIANREIGLKIDAKYARRVLSQVDNHRLFELGLAPYALTMDAKKDATISNLANLYEEACTKEGRVDFDKLIQSVVWGFRRNPALANRIGAIWTTVTIDEAQDTDALQFELITQLAPHGNICLVGDQDQVIYGFRGANFRNMANFVAHFKAVRLPLEVNYRSKAEVIEMANQVIKQNKDRFDKTMRPSLGEGGEVFLANHTTAWSEADHITNVIRRGLRQGENPSRYAVLYRIGALSRALESCFVKANIPYRVVGGLRFWERREVKDTIAYAKVLAGKRDLEAWRRATENPPIGLGDKGWGAVLGQADTEEAIAALGNAKAKAWVATLRMARSRGVNADSLAAFITMSGYRAYLEKDSGGAEEAVQRLANVDETLEAIRSFNSLEEFLDDIALGLPAKSDDDGRPAVTLTTIHGAKGLEWDHVFLVGVLDGIMPHERAALPEEVEEERRLLYVAITRAKKRLQLNTYREEQRNGTMIPARRSRFLHGIQVQEVRL